MSENALTRILEERQLHGYSPDGFYLLYGEYTINYCGSYYGYVYREDDPNPDYEHEYGWHSFEEALDSTIEEIGKTLREILRETPADMIDVHW